MYLEYGDLPPFAFDLVVMISHCTIYDLSHFEISFGFTLLFPVLSAHGASYIPFQHLSHGSPLVLTIII